MTQSQAIESGGADLQGSERERVIRKIKRCLALGQSSNQNEADMAMRQAQAMMRAYRLSEVDVHASSVNCETRDAGATRLPEWQRYLGAAAAKAFGCNFYSRAGAAGLFNAQFIFVGVMPAAELSAYAYDTLLTQLKAARKAFQKEHKGVARKVADDFCLAWVHAVDQKVTQFARDNPVPGAQANALVLVQTQEQAAIDAWVAKEFKKVVSRKPPKRKERNLYALQLGHKAGEKAVINQAVQGARGGALQLTTATNEG